MTTELVTEPELELLSELASELTSEMLLDLLVKPNNPGHRLQKSRQRLDRREGEKGERMGWH